MCVCVLGGRLARKPQGLACLRLPVSPHSHHHNHNHCCFLHGGCRDGSVGKVLAKNLSWQVISLVTSCCFLMKGGIEDPVSLSFSEVVKRAWGTLFKIFLSQILKKKI